MLKIGGVLFAKDNAGESKLKDGGTETLIRTAKEIHSFFDQNLW
jgi:hypothetical protein